MSTTPMTGDVINAILGVDENSKIARLRGTKPNQIDELQDYYLALFEPSAESRAALPLIDRYIVAVRVASHTGSTAVANWYTGLATDAGVRAETIGRVRNVIVPWEDETALGAAIRHADLLAKRPADARPEHLEALKRSGFSPAGILSLSQVIAFVSYQVRLIAGLRALGAGS